MILKLGEWQPELLGEGQFIADSARVVGKVRLHAGVSIWFGAVVRGDNDWIDIGRNSNIQDGAILHTDPGMALNIGEGVTVGHRAMLHGCSIGNGCLIGIGSTVLNNARLGEHCLVGAHALITEGKEFPDKVLIVGAPAHVVRELTSEELVMLDAAAESYVHNGRHYRTQLAAADKG
jgi:carbonic anhydrase/acetyltransferase-like protein (isoleucine patch superfamily)